MFTNKRKEKGFVLFVVLLFVGIFFIMTVALISFVNAEINMTKHRINSIKAFFLAEAGIARAMAGIRDTGDAGSVPSGFMLAETGVVNNIYLDNINIVIEQPVSLGGNMYQVTAHATVSGSTRAITANLMHNPPSKVFDYAYFLNNWGWFYGSSITANGDVRSNGRFDFRYGPTVEGEIYAAQGIGGGDTVRGKAGTEEDGEYIYQHPDSPSVEMPNLQDLSYYQALADESNSTIKINDTVIVDRVFGDDIGESGNIVLIGTPDAPIEVDGPVVITGDVVIKGTVTGQGTVYSGRNLYVAGNIYYANGPASPRPSSDDPEVIDQWVEDNTTKDVIGFAATENIIFGDYTVMAWPYNWNWLVDNYLFQMGSEDVGEDGIPDTSDAGEGDGAFQEQYEDLDEDGVFDDNYNWSDVFTQDDIRNFYNAPAGTLSFSDIATNQISELNGVFYTNHAMAGWGNSLVFNGAIVSKDESILAYNSITMNFDERLHSRYRYDPNWLIDLKLPVFEGITREAWWEG